jgi:tetratricopeptide (TPR) repeat protein
MALPAAPAPVLSQASEEATPEETRAELVARWQEALELDLAAEIVREAPRRLLAEPQLSSDGDALALYARALALTGGREQAYALLSDAQPSPETLAGRELGLARLELEDDRLSAVVRRLATPDPENPVRFPARAEAWVLLGKARFRAGDPAGAAPLLQRFVSSWRLHLEGPSAWHLLSQEALSRRDVENARTFRARGQSLASWHAFHKTRRIQIREAPDDPLPRFGLAQLWASVDELEHARAEVERVIAMDGDFARAWALLGELERKSGDDARATAAYDRALELDETLTDARFNRALLAVGRGDDDGARKDLERITAGAQSAQPRYLGAHLALARLLKRTGDDAAARERHSRYTELGGTESL